MDNHEYLKAYTVWKDQVNTEDQDTPERFAAYLKSIEDAKTVEFARETFSFVMDSISGAGTMDAPTIRGTFLPVAEALGLDTTWWKPKALTDAKAD